MARNIDLNSDAWCKLVFEGKNQKYGAYYLRKTSSKRHLWAFSIVVILCVLILLSLLLSNFIQLKKTEDVELRPVELSTLIMMEPTPVENQTMPIDNPPLKEVITYTPPEVIEDEDIAKAREELAEVTVSNDSMKIDSILIEQMLRKQKESELAEKTNPQTADGLNRNDTVPEFPGGQTALLRYIYQNIQYPPAAFKQKIQGRVICSFIIKEDGSVSDVTLVRGVYIFLDEEVLRVARSMPVWKPAMRDGKAIEVKYYMPVEFRP